MMTKYEEEIDLSLEKVPMTIYVPKWIPNLTADAAEDCAHLTKTQVRSQVYEGAMREILDFTEEGYTPLQSIFLYNYKLNKK